MFSLGAVTTAEIDLVAAFDVPAHEPLDSIRPKSRRDPGAILEAIGNGRRGSHRREPASGR